MKNVWKMAFLSTVFVLTACKGGGGGASSWFGGGGANNIPTASVGSLTGTAATGAPMINADVVIKGVGAGCPLTAKTDSDGVYTKDVGTCGAPYIIKVTGSQGTVYSVAPTSGVIANATPLTTIVATRALGSVDIGSINPVDKIIELGTSNINDKVAEVKAIIQPLLNRFGAGNMNILSGGFVANGESIDSVLDAIKVSADNAGDLKMEIKGSNVSVTISSDDQVVDSSAMATTIQAGADQAVQTVGIIDNIYVSLKKAFEEKKLLDYCDTEFKDFGYSCTILNSELEDSYTVNRPTLIEKIGDDKAWVSFEVSQVYDGQTYVFPIVMQMKKNGVTWKLYGNQVSPFFELMGQQWKIGGSRNGVPLNAVTGAGFKISLWKPEGTSQSLDTTKTVKITPNRVAADAIEFNFTSGTYPGIKYFDDNDNIIPTLSEYYPPQDVSFKGGYPYNELLKISETKLNSYPTMLPIKLEYYEEGIAEKKEAQFYIVAPPKASDSLVVPEIDPSGGVEGKCPTEVSIPTDSSTGLDPRLTLDHLYVHWENWDLDNGTMICRRKTPENGEFTLPYTLNEANTTGDREGSEGCQVSTTDLHYGFISAVKYTDSIGRKLANYYQCF